MQECLSEVRQLTDSDRPSSAVKLNWEGGFRFESRDTHGHSLTLDAPQSDGDAFEGFMPGDMLLTALAGCSGIDVVNILERMRQKVEGIEISVKGHQNPGSSLDLGGHRDSLHDPGLRPERSPCQARHQPFREQVLLNRRDRWRTRPG